MGGAGPHPHRRLPRVLGRGGARGPGGGGGRGDEGGPGAQGGGEGQGARGGDGQQSATVRGHGGVFRSRAGPYAAGGTGRFLSADVLTAGPP
ncbi:hypothetical protein DMH15_18755 [Streptomyces sp. WAC 06725]|nr:hypothetical protein DMH15_18755 [Streptomyces sp. WAC 06725]